MSMNNPQTPTRDNIQAHKSALWGTLFGLVFGISLFLGLNYIMVLTSNIQIPTYIQQIVITGGIIVALINAGRHGYYLLTIKTKHPEVWVDHKIHPPQ